MLRGQLLHKKAGGFTIVELLIVIVVIAILAAITIVAYNGISNRAKQAAVQSAAAQAYRKILSEATLNSDTYPSSINGLGLTNSGNITYQYSVNSSDPTGFCLTAVSNQVAAYTARTYTYNGGTVLDQSSPASGACPGHSSTGGSVVTNLAVNPSFEANTMTGSSSSVALSSTWASSGTNSLRVTNSGTANAGDVRLPGGSQVSFPNGMEPGKTYTVSARLYFTAAPTGGYNRAPGVLYWYSTNGSSYTEAFGPKAPTTPGTYTVSHTFTIPANATGIVVGFGVASSTASQIFYYDSVMVTEGSTVENFADGNTPGWIWKGTVNASSSTGASQ